MVAKHHLQWTCFSFNAPSKKHNICGSHEKNMSAQKHYRFTLNGLETFDWQPTCNSVRLDLREGKVTGAADDATEMSQGRVSCADWGRSRLLQSFVWKLSTSQQSKLNWPQNYSSSPLSSAHHAYHCWPCDSVLLCNVYICAVQSKRRTLQIKDHLLTNVISNLIHWKAQNLCHNLITIHFS